MSLNFLFKNYGYKLFNRLGLYVRKLYTPEETYNNLKRKSYEVEKQELKHLSFFISSSNDHRYYNSLLKLYVPKWEVEIEKAEFIGSGGGNGNLSAFRKVDFGENSCFEKVYFTRSKDLQTILWFDQHISDRLRNTLRTPKIQKFFMGELLTIVYMDFFHLEPFQNGEVEKELIRLSKVLYEIDFKVFLNDNQSIPTQILDYTCHSMFQLNAELVKEKLHQRNFDILQFEKKIQQSKRAFTHGDFIGRNTAKNNSIIDWDSVGFFPIGMDQAYLYYFIYLKENKKPFIEPDTWLCTHYVNFIEEGNWSQFRLNFTYFLLVFAWRIFMVDVHLRVKERLLDNLAALYNNST